MNPEDDGRRVWKYVIPVRGWDEPVDVALPFGSEVLYIADQSATGDVSMWLLVDSDRPTHDEKLFVVGTGHPIPDAAARHLGTAVAFEGRLVWHVFTTDDSSLRSPYKATRHGSLVG